MTLQDIINKVESQIEVARDEAATSGDYDDYGEGIGQLEVVLIILRLSTVRDAWLDEED